MPSDHTSIAARHRARTLSRAKSLRKHQRWLAQHQERHQSQPDLHTTDFDKQQFKDAFLRRATSLREQRSCGTSASDAPDGWKKALVSPFASTATLANVVGPFTPLTGVLNSASGSLLPWKEVNWNRSRRKLGLSSSLEPILTPYPATTTRQVSHAASKTVTAFSAGEIDAATHLRQTRRRYMPKPANLGSAAVTVPTTASQTRRASSPPRPVSLNSSNTLTATDSNTTSSSQVSDSDALMYLYASSVTANARLREQQQQHRFKSPPRAHTYSHPNRGEWTVNKTDEVQEQEREEHRPLLSPPSTPYRSDTQARRQVQPKVRGKTRDESPQRHQRGRHPRLIYPYAPGHGASKSNLDESQDKSLNIPPATHDKKPSTLKVRKFIDGYWRWVTLPSSQPRQSGRTSTDSTDERKPLLPSGFVHDDETQVDEISTFIPGKTLWNASKIRSSISSLASTTNANMKTAGANVKATAEKLVSGIGFWPAGPRRML